MNNDEIHLEVSDVISSYYLEKHIDIIMLNEIRNIFTDITTEIDIQLDVIIGSIFFE